MRTILIIYLIQTSVQSFPITLVYIQLMKLLLTSFSSAEFIENIYFKFLFNLFKNTHSKHLQQFEYKEYRNYSDDETHHNCKFHDGNFNILHGKMYILPIKNLLNFEMTLKYDPLRSDEISAFGLLLEPDDFFFLLF